MNSHVFKEIGTSRQRVDAVAKAYGEHAYPSDIAAYRALWLHVVRSARAHAEIVSLDVTAAKAVAGVAAVLTHADIPAAKTFGALAPDQPFLAIERVRYIGEPVVVIAAESDAIARKAAALVEITYNDLPRVDFPPAADTPPLHGEAHEVLAMPMGFGDVAALAPQAAIESRIAFATPRQEHGFLETEAGASWFDEDGVLTLSVGGQGPHHDQKAISDALGLPLDKVRVLNPMMGGAFGGKEDLNVQLPLALTTFVTGRPARLMLTREESISYSVKRHAYHVDYHVTATRAGQLLAADVKLQSDGGAYLTYTPVVLSQSVEHATGPYRFQGVRIDAKAYFTNNGVASAFRGVGAPQVIPAIEQAIDDIARQLDLSPFDIRRRNLLAKGDTAGAGYPMAETPAMSELLDAAEQGPIWQGRETFKAAAGPYKARGVGVAAVFYSFGLGSGAEAGATVRLSRTENGRYLLELGVPDVGNGNLTSFLMIAAEHLDVSFDLLDYRMGDSFGPNSGLTHGSRTTYVVGNAVAAAAKRLKTQCDAAGADFAQSVELSFTPEQAPQHVFGMPHIAYTYLVQVMALEVDLLTGQVLPLEVENYVEVGRAINPQSVEGQIEGAFAQGLGFALHEDLVVDEGWVKNGNFTNYIIATTCDMPRRMTTRIFENPDLTNPLGVRGLGEIGLPIVPASVANALCDATGKRFAKFPITPEAVLGAIGA